MNTDDLRHALADMKSAFMEFQYFRCNAARHIMPEDFNSYEVAGQFWRGWHEAQNILREHDAESDEIVEAVYEEALEREEPWALDAFNARRRAQIEEP